MNKTTGLLLAAVLVTATGCSAMLAQQKLNAIGPEPVLSYAGCERSMSGEASCQAFRERIHDINMSTYREKERVYNGGAIPPLSNEGRAALAMEEIARNTRPTLNLYQHQENDGRTNNYPYSSPPFPGFWHQVYPNDNRF